MLANFWNLRILKMKKLLRILKKCQDVRPDPILVLGHNDYIGRGSIFTHNDPESLLRKFAGKGHPERYQAGECGFKETVDFGEIIGIWKNKQGTEIMPTTRGTLHYGKKGAHIVPSSPNPKIGGKA